MSKKYVKNGLDEIGNHEKHFLENFLKSLKKKSAKCDNKYKGEILWLQKI